MIADLIPRTFGEIRIGGTSVTGPYTDLGFVFQDAVLLDRRSAMANVLLQAELRGKKKRAYEERARELLKLVGLSGFEERYPFELSGGMRQRVCLCRALLHDPPLLLMAWVHPALVIRWRCSVSTNHVSPPRKTSAITRSPVRRTTAAIMTFPLSKVAMRIE